MIIKFKSFINEIKLNQDNDVSEISKEQLEKLIGFDNNQEEISRLKNLLNILPDYSNISINFKSNKVGLGYVNSIEHKKDKIISIIEFNGLPSPEVYVHELYHYFTLPALVRTDVTSCFNYVNKMQYLYEYYKNIGYSVINGTSIHDNLAEFCVNITNKKSYQDMIRFGFYDEYFSNTKEYLSSIS